MKIIRSIGRILAKTMIGFILFIAVAYGIILLPWTQAKITSYVSSVISEEIGLTVHIERITPILWKSARVHNITVTNDRNDTILTAPLCKVAINRIQLDSARVDIKHIKLHNASLRVIQDRNGVWNITNFIQEVIESPGTKSWKIGIHDIELTGSRVRVTSLKEPSTYSGTGINMNDIIVTDLRLLASNFTKHKRNFTARIENLSCREQSGLVIQHFQTEARISDTLLQCKNIILFTPHTKFFSQSTEFAYTSFDDFSNFINKVSITSSIEYSQISFKDIGYFNDDAAQIPYTFKLSGNVKGRISNIKGKNIHIGFNTSSRFIGNIECSGLPDISQTFMHIDAKLIETNKRDIQRLRIPPYDTETYATIPAILDNIETYSYSGNITGFLHDFVAYGTLTTNIGTVYSDILISQSSHKASLYNYSGKLTCIDLELDKFPVQKNTWGKMNASFEVKGLYDNDNIVSAQVTGAIRSIEFMKYTYQSITIDGLLAKQKFDGSLQIDDKNLKLSFHGLFDYSDETPSFNFTASIPHADIYALKLYSDSIAVLSLETEVDFVGIQLDNLKGYIRIPHASFTSKYGTYSSKQTNIDIDNIQQTRNISIRSDLFDLSINGKGSYKELPIFFYDFLQSHIPSLPSQRFDAKKTIIPGFNASLKIKKIDSLLQVLYPDIHIAQNSYINTVYSEESKQLIIQSNIPEFSIGEHIFSNISIQTNGTNEILQTQIEFDYDIFKKNTLAIDIIQDSIYSTVSWRNTDEKRYEGELTCSGIFAKSTHKIFPALQLDIPKQSLYIADTLWNIYTTKLMIDSSSVYIPIGSFGKHNQRVTIEGTISENSHDILKANFFNYNIENFNYIIDNSNVMLAGALQGNLEIKDVYNNMLIFSNIASQNFSFNGHQLGKLSIVSQWIPLQKAIAMNIGIQQGNTYIAQAIGTYVPSSGAIDYSLQVKDLRMSIFKEIFSSTISSLSGYIEGAIQASGSINNPIFTGNLDVKRGKFKINETQVTYTTKGTIQSQGSKLVFYDLPILDSLTNVGLARGFVDFKQLNNPTYTIELETDKIIALYTGEQNNASFYGNALFQGTVNIQGDLYNTSIVAVGKTLENTRLNIPLSYSELTENKDFLRFSKSKTTQQTAAQQTSISGTDIQMNIQVTPDALTQIIFDKQVGDIIKVRGAGNIQMNMDKIGNFTMYGDYTIESGDYLFTLKNLINKKFNIQNGGTITFNGDPFEAQIDVLAQYDLKASPLPIVPALESKDTAIYKRRIPVQCNILLQNNLMNPDISYNISVASGYSNVQDILNAMSSDDKNKQFLSLLLMNAFFSQTDATINSSASFEVLTNQLNNLLSQSYSNIDLGVNYRPGDLYSGNEFELALSTQLLNNRILVNVNGYSEFGQSTDQTKRQNSEIAGDVSVEIKLTKQGNFRLKAFSRNNNDPIENRGNTQGVSIFFTREFNTFRDFLKKR